MMKTRYVWFCESWVILLLLAGLGTLVMLQYRILTHNIKSRSDIVHIDQIEFDDANLADTLAFRMIEYDVQHGISTNATARKAKNNVAFYQQKVGETCNDKDMTSFFSCANDLLGTYFYYTPSTETSNNYAKQQSDCDLNAYLLYDAAHKQGIDTYVVYSPGHAFLGWKDKDGLFHYFETTANENHGKSADFTTPLYRKTLDSTYYAPIKADAIYRNYPFLVMGLFSEEANITINPKLDGNALESDAYLMLKMKNGTLSQGDIDYAERLLQTDITSTVKKQIIAQWYLNDHNAEMASTYLKQIKSQYCNSECVALKQQLGPIQSMIYAIYPAYHAIGKKFEIDVSSSQYFCLLFMLAVSFLLLIVLLLRKYSTRVIRL